MPRVSGAASATTGTAWVSVHSLNFASAILRVVMPMTTTKAATAAARLVANQSLRRDRMGGAGSGGMRFSKRRDRRLAAAFVKDTEDDRHEHQRCNGSA